MELDSCGCKKNQTHPEVLAAAGRNGVDALSIPGFGVFVIPAPEKGILEYKVVVVEDLTYLECVKRGANCPAFKWVNRGFEWTTTGPGQAVHVVLDSKETLMRELEVHCASPCIGFNDCPPWCPCVGTCGGGL
jgi:hypothetical protein